MDLQLQLKRALIAFAVWAVLGGIALSRAAPETPAAMPAPARAHALARVFVADTLAEARCETRLRIDLTASLRVTLACDRSCKPLRGVAQALGMPVQAESAQCAFLRSA